MTITVIHEVIKIKDLYFIWDAEKKRPLTHGLKKYELKEWIEANEGEFGIDLIEKRLKMLDEQGLSIPDNDIITLDVFLSNNKASVSRQHLSKEDIYKIYDYSYIDDINKSNDSNDEYNKALHRLPDAISMSSKFYLFFILITFVLIGLYYSPEISAVNDFILRYEVNVQKIHMIIFTLLGILLGIMISPRLYLWKYKK